MALEQQLDWAEVKFGTPLSAAGVDILLAHLAQQLSARIDYVVEQGKSVGERVGDDDPSAERIMLGGRLVGRSLTSLHVRGSISSYSDSAASASFRGQNSEEDPLLVAGLRFETIPGYRQEEHRPEVVALVDAVQREVSRCIFVFVPLGAYFR